MDTLGSIVVNIPGMKPNILLNPIIQEEIQKEWRNLHLDFMMGGKASESTSSDFFYSAILSSAALPPKS